MQLLLALLPLAALALAADPPAIITDPALCHCQEQFAARPFGAKGEYRCSGLRLRIVKPCNTPRRPRCACTEATGILTDHTGVWCTQYGGGREVRRWACENAAQWEAFFEEHPDQKFQEVDL